MDGMKKGKRRANYEKNYLKITKIRVKCHRTLMFKNNNKNESIFTIY